MGSRPRWWDGVRGLGGKPTPGLPALSTGKAARVAVEAVYVPLRAGTSWKGSAPTLPDASDVQRNEPGKAHGTRRGGFKDRCRVPARRRSSSERPGGHARPLQWLARPAPDKSHIGGWRCQAGLKGGEYSTASSSRLVTRRTGSPVSFTVFFLISIHSSSARKRFHWRSMVATSGHFKM